MSSPLLINSSIRNVFHLLITTSKCSESRTRANLVIHFKCVEKYSQSATHSVQSVIVSKEVLQSTTLLSPKTQNGGQDLISESPDKKSSRSRKYWITLAFMNCLSFQICRWLQNGAIYTKIGDQSTAQCGEPTRMQLIYKTKYVRPWWTLLLASKMRARSCILE